MNKKSIEKRNLLYSFAILTLGVIIAVLNIFIHIPNKIVNISRGLFFAGFICSIFHLFILKISKKINRLDETDEYDENEKNILLKEKVSSKIYSIFLYLECLCIIISSFFKYQKILYILSIVITAKLLTWIFIASKFTKNIIDE
ncbi:hypothetical protein [Clostridium sp. BJN0001]|uniref:hypothetical protein n=1 Tax=Clostridium sp. BJN0001 TaxID=2930219 RepID=UPI001FD30563|nr:hypothetical protein [Clostridium sp. BJN0001]